jgi:tetratricopeptide (TPR) repeat protein
MAGVAQHGPPSSSNRGNAAEPPRKIRVFVSSPADVDSERRRMMEIIAALNRRYEGRVILEGVFWEQTVYPAHATFQALIDDPASCDLVICILWSRLGSPLPRDWPRRADGTPYESGTVYEFETALAARRARPFPDIFMFRKLLPANRAALSDLMEQHPAERLGILDYLMRSSTEDSRAAIQLLENFWKQWFYSADKGFVAAFNTFGTADEFAAMARKAIEDWLIGRNFVSRRPDWDIKAQGSPYPGLEPFAGERAAVFFGRSRATERALALLRGAADAGFPWLLVTGPSGSGKSSLLRAGVVPKLTQDTVLEAWRTVVVQPGSVDPLQSLLDAVAGAEVLGPALARGDFPTAEDLVRIAHAAPAELARALIRALDRHAESVREANNRNTPPATRLLLVIDQMEDLVLAPEPSQASFGAVILALVSGTGSRIWVAGTLRSDLQEPLLKIAALQTLVTLERGGQELKVAPPGPADMREVIEEPAVRAGLFFEVRQSDGRSLVEELVQSVSGAADALPLLQLTLALLFDRRDRERNELRWSDYETIGRLEGAIANHAEAVLAARPAGERAELGPLLRQLTRAWLSVEGEIELRPTQIEEVSLRGARAELARRLIEGRLLVADRGRLRIVHEAVLRNWRRAQELLAADLDLARLEARLEPVLAEWVAAGRNPNDATRLLPAGAQLGAADALAKRYSAAEIGEDLAAFITASVDFERHQRNRRQRILAGIAAAFAALMLLAATGGFFAMHERDLATVALNDAEKNYRLALDQAAGSVRLLEDSYEIGALSSALLRQLVGKAQATVNNLPDGGDDVIAAQMKLLGVLTVGNLTLGNIPAARTYADRERALADSLVAKEPSRTAWRRLWASADAHSAAVLFWQGEIPRAIELSKAAIDAAAALAAAEPDDDGLHADLMSLEMSFGDSLRLRGDLVEAGKAYHSWLDEAAAQAAREPNNPDWQRHLAFSHQRLADVFMIMGNPAEAAKEYRIEAEIGAKLVALAPDNGLANEAVVFAHLRLGDTFLVQDQFAEADSEYRLSLDNSDAALALDPTNYRWRSVAEGTRQRLGELAMKRRDYVAAEGEFATSLKMAEETLHKDHDNNAALFDAANAHQEAGDGFREAGKLPEALREYREALSLADELNRRLSTNPAWQKMLAVAHQRIGMILRLQGNPQGAVGEFRACVAIPVSATIFAPRLLWPKDVDGYCRDELAHLGG